MIPKGVTLREARDSEAHPDSFPGILGLDVTASMGHVPHDLIKTGLPKLMGSLIQGGCPDISLCFVAFGDHEVDRAPLQIGQFESGDSELDMWLERTWLEGGGGGNAGESYLLVWAFAAFVCDTDHWDKRGHKGVLVTVGDEPNLQTLPTSAAVEIFGEQARDWWQGSSITADALLRLAQEKWEVFHLHVQHGSRWRGSDQALAQWRDRLGQQAIEVDGAEGVPEAVVNAVLSRMDAIVPPATTSTQEVSTTPATEEETPEVEDVTADPPSEDRPGVDVSDEVETI